MVILFSGILLKLLPPDVIFCSYNVPNSISAGAPPQTPLGELTALPRPIAAFGGCFAVGGGAGLEKRRRRGRRGKWKGGKGRAPKLLLNQGPSEPCYATD